MLVALDTSCVVNLLSGAEIPNSALIGLVRSGLDGVVQLNITPIVGVELPDIGRGDEGRVESRRYIRESLDQFPTLTISASRQAERNELATQLVRLLWPNVLEGSRKYRHSLLDCAHLASLRICGGDAFVTLDDELIRKASRNRELVGIEVLSPEDLISRLKPDISLSTTAWMPTVRKAADDDRGEIRALLASIRDTYDDFDGWLSRALLSKEMWVGVLDGRIGAVSVWAQKVGTSTVKLSTFFVGEAFSGRGLGPHLLFQQIRLWVERGYSKVFVTVSSDRLQALAFFLTYGFRIEGSSARRYKSNAVEFVLAKHFVYEVVNPERFEPFLREVADQLFNLPPNPAVCARDSWFHPPTFGSARAVEGADGQVTGVEVRSGDGTPVRMFKLGRFEELVYPARFATTGRRAYLIPIRPQWADAMMQIPRAQGSLFASSDKLALRSDNAYYLHPRYLDEAVDGCPVLFYVSQPDKMIAGFARIVERCVAEPEDLFLKFDRLGVYGLANIREHVKKDGRDAGCAMAIRFAWWVPFSTPVTLDAMRRCFGMEAPQTITAINCVQYEAILRAGGVKW